MEEYCMAYSVYMHTSPHGKVYIGITCKPPEFRWKNGFGYTNNKHFYNAISKFGWSNFKHDILDSNLTKEEAEEKEIQLIKKYKSNNPKYGYNISAGGKSANGYKHTESTKKKISNSLKGQKHTASRLLNQSITWKKLWQSAEFRLKMSVAHKGKNRGSANPSSKEVYQYGLNGNLISVFESVGEAERITGIDHRQICACCNHKRKTCHGHVWKYEKDGE